MKGYCAKYLLLCCCLTLCQMAAGQGADTFNIYFPMNDPRETPASAALIDSIVRHGLLRQSQHLIIQGYADYVGDSAYNETLSSKRALNVENHLLASGFNPQYIKLCIGKGKIDRAPVNGNDGYAADRKVQIIIDRHATEQPPTAEPPHTGATATLAATALQKPIADASAPLSLAAAMDQTPVNQTMILDNILFIPDEDLIVPSSQPVLDSLYKYLDANPTVSIQIEGHICCVDPKKGDDLPFAMSNLSTARAMAIYMYLVLKGVDKQRLKYKGLGNRVPLVKPELTEADKKKNRRVEIRVLGR